jgi:branched-chain amino acid transport system ATP-binding protein
LDVRGVTAAYGETVALRDVSLSVPAGSVVALLGPNGAGKTTLLSVCSGLVRPMHGDVHLDGHPVTSSGVDRRVQMGLCHITEGRSVFPGLSVGDNLRMFAPPGSGPDAVDRAVAAFPRLGERIRQTVGTMSGGEQQMLALARAYVQRAPLVMLDEVSMGLAPIVVDEIFDFLHRLKGEGHSLLLVEQYVAKALAIADVVYLLVRGRVVFAGQPGEVVGTDISQYYLGERNGHSDVRV